MLEILQHEFAGLGAGKLEEILWWGAGSALATLILFSLIIRKGWGVLLGLILGIVVGLFVMNWKAKGLYAENDKLLNLYCEHDVFASFWVDFPTYMDIDDFGNRVQRLRMDTLARLEINLPDSVITFLEEVYEHFGIDTVYAVAGYQGVASIPMCLARQSEGQWSPAEYPTFKKQVETMVSERSIKPPDSYLQWLQSQMMLYAYQHVDYMLMLKQYRHAEWVKKEPSLRHSPAFTLRIWAAAPAMYDHAKLRLKGTAFDEEVMRAAIDPTTGKPLDHENMPKEKLPKLRD